MARFNAAFINNISDEGTKAEAVRFLQETWDELQSLRMALMRRGYTYQQLDDMSKLYQLSGKIT